MTQAQKKEPEGKENKDLQNFSADVSRLLNIVANALYTNHDVFLRELISNAADACDRLRYEAIQKPDLTKDDPNYRIHVWHDAKERQLYVFDNGIGMSKAELADNLGTIAKSGTAKIMESLKKNKGKEDDALKLIGQFGVGFYASYMVASRVTVISRKAGNKSAWVWDSDGATGFSIRKAKKEEEESLHGTRGTLITLDIKDEGSEFLIDEKIRQTIEYYSDHIDVPIYNCPAKLKEGQLAVNQASALWTRPKSEITKEEYDKFYKHVSHGFDEPIMTAHWKAEGAIEFTALLFIPTMRTWDLYDPGRKNAVRLYVRRVFISDELETLMYPWLRFVKGVIDSEDLPLNISRETLQYNPIINKIRSSVARRVLNDLEKLAKDDWPGFVTFWGQFGPAIKEGLYDAPEHREGIFKICRFYSSQDNGEKMVSLDEYVERMAKEQDEIYYISGESAENLKNSPQLEGFRARGLEVLFFTDTIDDFWLQQIHDYKGKAFKSITKGNIDLDKYESANDEQKEDSDKNQEEQADITELLAHMKETLSEDVSDVIISKRLTSSPVCLVAPEGGVDMNMERVLKIHQKYAGQTKPVLEINAKHDLVQALGALFNAKEEDKVQDLTWLLFDQAKIIQGEPLKDPARFVQKMSEYLGKAID